MSRARQFASLAALSVFLVFLSACDAGEQRTIPVEPAEEVLSAKPLGCGTFGSMAKDARDYFPGKGQGSVSQQAQNLIDEMEDACESDASVLYTDLVYQAFGIVEAVLEAGTGGNPDAGSSFLAGAVSAVGPDGTRLVFDPCSGLAPAICTPWEGFPTPPDFASALSSEDGALAVVSSSGDLVCSEFQFPCPGATAMAGDDTWGVVPSGSATWAAALGVSQALIFGHPLPDVTGPTGEMLLQTELPAYRWLLIPDVTKFQSELEVGLCSPASPALDQTLMEKGNTVLFEVGVGWCNGVAASTSSPLDRLLAFLSPAPAPLVAARAAEGGPGGRAGGFTDFFAVQLNEPADLVLSGQPQDAFVDQVITVEGGAPFSIRAETSTQQTALEDALIIATVIGNGGLVASGAGVSGVGLGCEDFQCEGRTQADEDPNPGQLDLPLVITKPGQYSLCFTATFPGQTFLEVCTGKFIIRP